MVRRVKPTLRKASRAKVYKKFRRPNPRKRAVTNRGMVVLGNGFPDKILVTHRYRDQITLTSTSGVISTYQWSCNGMYDPNSSGGGHQPLWFDQMTPLYNHYQVIGSRCKLRILPHTANSVTSNFTCFVNDNTAFSNASVDGIAEQNGAIATPVGVASGGNKPLVRKMYWSSKRKFGTSSLGNTNFQGSITTNPPEQSYYSLALQAFDQTNSCQLQIFVEIEYIAVWSEVRDVVQS